MTQHRNNLNLIRLLLAIGVLFSHGFELVDGNRNREPFVQLLSGRTGGEICVMAFFVLSGYLVGNSWRRDPDAVRFLVRRTARIFPGFFICSLICAFVFGPVASGVGQYWTHFPIAMYLFSLANLHGPITPPVFTGSHYPAINGSMWTIRLEFRCYLWALFLGSLRFCRPLVGWLVCGTAFGLASLFPGLLAQLAFRGDYWTTGPVHQMVPFLFDFSVGALFCFIPKTWLSHAVVLLALPAWIVLDQVFPTAAELLLPATICCLVLNLGELRFAWLARIRPKWDISYGVYLYAWPIQKLLLMGWPALGPHGLFVAAMPLTAVAAILSWRAVEQPSLQLAQRWLSNQAALLSGPLEA